MTPGRFRTGLCRIGRPRQPPARMRILIAEIQAIVEHAAQQQVTLAPELLAGFGPTAQDEDGGGDDPPPKLREVKPPGGDDAGKDSGC